MSVETNELVQVVAELKEDKVPVMCGGAWKRAMIRFISSVISSRGCAWSGINMARAASTFPD